MGCFHFHNMSSKSWLYIHEWKTCASPMFTDLYRNEGLTGLVLATFICFTYLELMNVHTAGEPTVCTLYLFDIIHFSFDSLFVCV